MIKDVFGKNKIIESSPGRIDDNSLHSGKNLQLLIYTLLNKN